MTSVTRDGPEGGPGRAVGRVVSVSRRGNLATNLPGDWLQGAAMVEVARARVPVARRYDDVAPGEGMARVGRDGRVEVAVRDGSAAVSYRASRGSRVALVPENA